MSEDNFPPLSKRKQLSIIRNRLKMSKESMAYALDYLNKRCKDSEEALTQYNIVMRNHNKIVEELEELTGKGE